MGFVFNMLAGASSFVMANMPRVIEWGGTAVTASPTLIDCANSAKNGLSRTEEPSPNQACYVAGEMASHIIGVSDAYAGDVDAQSLPSRKSDGPQVPIAQ